MQARQAGQRRASATNNTRGTDYIHRGPTAEEFVQKCLEESGDQYRLSAENTPGTPPEKTTHWDCSELVEVKLRELGIQAPDGSKAQLAWCEENNAIIPLEQGVQTRGALLLRKTKPGEQYGHVAVSLGNGQTIEAKGKDFGVGVFSATGGRAFTHAALVPGLTYGGTRVPPDQSNPSTPIQPSNRPTLRRGSSGSDVRFLQERLKKLGYDPGPIDGVFGPRTEGAVKDFQVNRGLVADGIVGKKTWGALT